MLICINILRDITAVISLFPFINLNLQKYYSDFLKVLVFNLISHRLRLVIYSSYAKWGNWRAGPT